MVAEKNTNISKSISSYSATEVAEVNKMAEPFPNSISAATATVEVALKANLMSQMLGGFAT